MDKGKRKAQLESLTALVDAELGDVAGALEKLAAFTDPDSLRRRIYLLTRESRFQEAAELAKAFQIDPAFLEVAIQALVLNNEYDEAFRYLGLAPSLKDGTGTLPKRALGALADGAVKRHYEGLKNSFRIHLAVEPEMQSVFAKTEVLLAPYVEQILVTSEDETTLDVELVTLYTALCGYLGRGNKAESAMGFVGRHIESVNALSVGCLVVAGRLPNVEGLAEALLHNKQHPSEGLIMAAAIQANWNGNAAEAFQTLNSGLHNTKDPGGKARFFAGMLDAAHVGPQLLQTTIVAIAKQELDQNDPLHSACIARLLQRQGDIDGALALLDAMPLPSNPYWLEGKARCLSAKGDVKGSLALLKSMGEITCSEVNLIEVADIAYRSDDYKTAIGATRLISKYYPWMQLARRNLALLLVQDNQLDEAIVELERLTKESPEDMGLRAELARTYMQGGRLAKAEDNFRFVNSKPDPNVNAVILWSRVLRAMGRVAEAFAALERNKSRLWPDKGFLGEYLTCGYNAGKEAEAHEALMALDALRRQGLLEPEALRIGTIEELLALGEQNRKQQQELSEKTLAGGLPWTFVAELSRMPAIWSWTVRTQRMDNLTEDRWSRSAFNLYATNSCGVDYATDPEGEVNLIEGPPANGAVCIDISAMITLHKLGLLSTLAKMFSEVLASDKVPANLALETQQLLPQQRSSLDGAIELRNLVATKAIEVVHDRQSFHVDEYKASPTAADMPLSTLGGSLEAAGLMDMQAKERYRLTARRPIPNGTAAVPLKSKVSLDIETAMNLYRMQLLDVVVRNFSVSLLKSEYDDVLRDLVTYDAKRVALESLNEMIAQLRLLPNIKFETVRLEVEDKGFSESAALLASQIARNRGIPLLADDRVLQSLLINDRKTTIGVAFGTDVYLRALYERQLISKQQYANSYLQLIKWRYRFLIPPCSVLGELFDRYPDSIPGSDVMLCTRYMHDSLADPGLFAAPEKARVPTSVAMRLMMNWVKEITGFLAEVSIRPDISEERAVALATWIGKNMLPAVPANLAGRLESILGSYAPRASIAYTLLATGTHSGTSNSAKALRALASALGLSEKDYMQIVAEVLENALI